MEIIIQIAEIFYRKTGGDAIRSNEMKEVIKAVFMKNLIVLLLCVVSALHAQTSGEDLAVLNRMMRLKMDGLIPLRFTNALDGKPIDGATVDVAGIGVFVTNLGGIISFPEQEDGFYTLVFSKAGYITTALEFEVTLNNVFSNRISVSPVMRGDYLRIVLDWTDKPADLDIHLEKGPGSGGTPGYHISYRNMHDTADGLVLLDRDDRDGFGPETITVMETDLSAVYRLYIHDYTNGGNGASTALSRSGAVVRVYGRGGLLNAFTVPLNRAGTQWNVFRIVNGRVERE
jgi:hypothetical protein